MRVLETRRPVIVNDATPDGTVNIALMERFHIRGLAAVPLIIRDRVFGVLLAYIYGSAAPFAEEQLDFLQKAAGTLALAIENARLYETERDIADRLQEALISLPAEVGGLEFAHAYHSATEAVRVGGDFYDLFEMSPHHVGITIGDVAGKGLDAAVLTSLIRNTIRAHATETGRTPSQVLALTNEVVHNATGPESFATVFFGVLDRRDGRLTYSNAGHTTAALVCEDGGVEQWPGNGTVLGAFAGMEFGESDVHLGVGDLLFLYTDGVTEARRDGALYGEQRLFDLLASTRGSARDVVSDVVGDVVSYSQGTLRDDLAILAIRPTERLSHE
jgi:sigma-B regulation protein RsbU (phosphoserine phosphatase)